MHKKLMIYLRGFLMGICDLIPGISGGTIAFITGIYTRLINAVNAVSPKLFYDLVTYPVTGKKERLKEDIKKLDLIFLMVLGLGIATAILTGSRLIKFLLEEYLAHTLSFFIGLIVASSKTIFDHIENHNLKNFIFCFFGFAFGIILILIVPLEVKTPGLGYVFVGGFCAICAMFLPGISGAFILLILGLYEFMIGVLNNIRGNLSYFLMFAAGAAVGAFSISRVVLFLFKKNRCTTLYVLLGLVIGSLSIPIKKIMENASFEFLPVIIMILWLLAGGSLVVLIGNFRSAFESKDQTCPEQNRKKSVFKNKDVETNSSQ